MYWDCYKLWSVGDICYGFVHRSDTAEFISLAVCWQAASVGSRWSAFLDELSRSQRVSLFSPYTGWSKSICAPALIVFEQSPHTTDDFKMVITEYVRNVDRAVLNTVFENTVRRVNKYLENVPVDALNITCNFLYCNHQVHRDFLSTCAMNIAHECCGAPYLILFEICTQNLLPFHLSPVLPSRVGFWIKHPTIARECIVIREPTLVKWCPLHVCRMFASLWERKPFHRILPTSSFQYDRYNGSLVC